MNTAFGGVSAGGVGTPESEVTHTGGGPWAFVASQSGGNAGGMTPSKFSCIVERNQQGGHGGGVGSAPVRTSTRPQAVSSGEINPSIPWPVAREKLITAAAKTTTAVAAIANVVGRFITPSIISSSSPCEAKNEQTRTPKARTDSEDAR